MLVPLLGVVATTKISERISAHGMLDFGNDLSICF